jgi:type VI secretion system protein ImpF
VGAASSDVRVVPSVFDRLIDKEPGVSHDVIPTRAKSVDDFREAIQRDLEHLLNTKNPLADLRPEFIQVRQSTLAYGLPDFSAMNAENTKRFVGEALQYFEPRLKEVTVTESTDSSSGASYAAKDPLEPLMFHVDAKLDIDPAPEPVSFDVVVPKLTRTYKVKESP